MLPIITRTFVCCSLVAAMVNCASAQLTDELQKKLFEEWDEAKWAECSLVGEIVDRQGALLQEAKLLIGFDEKVRGDKDKRESVVSSDGKFRIIKKDASFVEIYVYKDRYHDQ